MVVVLPKSCCSHLSYNSTDGHTYRSQDLPAIGNGHKPNHVHLLEDSNIGDLDLDSNSNVTDVGYLLKKAMWTGVCYLLKIGMWISPNSNLAGFSSLSLTPLWMHTHTGHKIFQQPVTVTNQTECTYLIVQDGNISNLDLGSLNDTVIRYTGSHVVDGLTTFSGDVSLLGDLNVTGLVNGLQIPGRCCIGAPRVRGGWFGQSQWHGNPVYRE